VKRSKRGCTRENRLTVAAHVHGVLRHGGLPAVSVVSMAAMLSISALAEPALAAAAAASSDNNSSNSSQPGEMVSEVVVTGQRMAL
jgi:hypothetical protein